MARAHFVKKARKDNPAVKAGESYYWWQFPYRAKQYSKTAPTRSQLTSSFFLSELYSIQDEIEAMTEPSGLPELISRIEELGYECENSLENMPEHLQETSDSGILLQERIDAMGDWASELEGVDIEPDPEFADDDMEEWLEKVMDEIRDCEPMI